MEKLEIEVNGEQLDYVKETLNVKEAMDAFQESFTLPSNTYPFLIIENDITVRTLGVLDLGSRNISREVDCVVRFRESVIKGKITQLSRLDTGYRKCDLKFMGDITEIVSKPIQDFMPTIYLDPNAGAYDEDYDGDYNQDVWPSHVSTVNNKIWPQAKYVFPKIIHADREDDDLNDYSGVINHKDDNNALILNEYTPIDNFNATVTNQSRLAPKVYILSVLENIFSSIGWRIKGSFVDSPAIRAALFDLDKFQTFNDPLSPPGTALDFAAVNYQFFYGGNEAYNGSVMPVKEIVYTLPDDGDYVLEYDITMPVITTSTQNISLHHWGLYIRRDRQNPDSFAEFESGTKKGQLNFSGNQGDSFSIVQFSQRSVVATSIAVKVLRSTDLMPLQAYHPTLELGRYVPEWRVSDLLKNLRQLFNLKYHTNQDAKTITISFRKDLINYANISNLKIDSKIVNIAYSDQTSYIFKMQDENMPSVYIDQAQVIETAPDVEEAKNIQSDFKVILEDPAKYTNDYLSYQGSGIVFYDVLRDTIATEVYALSLIPTGVNGLFNKLWKTWLTSRLNAYTGDIENYMTMQEIERLKESEKVLIDDQLFILKELSTKQKESGSYETTATVETVSF